MTPVSVVEMSSIPLHRQTMFEPHVPLSSHSQPRNILHFMFCFVKQRGYPYFAAFVCIFPLILPSNSLTPTSVCPIPSLPTYIKPCSRLSTPKMSLPTQPDVRFTSPPPPVFWPKVTPCSLQCWRWAELTL